MEKVTMTVVTMYTARERGVKRQRVLAPPDVDVIRTRRRVILGERFEPKPTMWGYGFTVKAVGMEGNRLVVHVA